MNNERVTLAQELHDGIAQDLVVLGFSIDHAISICQETEVKNSLRQIRFTTTELIEKVNLRGGNVGVFPVSEKSWRDIGNWDEYLKVIENV